MISSYSKKFKISDTMPTSFESYIHYYTDINCLLGFDPHSGRRVLSLSKIHLPPKNTCDTQEEWLRSDMTENLLTGM